uniref:Ubiquitin-like protease family profile domain-containing protein n=2 Tax=Phlebotomus papatasi TaxID=29031 RepID=A0A1B0DIK7_PHLPP
PCILIFDSLAGGYRSRVVATLRDYLTCEYKAKICPTSNHTFNKDNMPGHSVKVPQQNNFTDCGLYLLQYVQEFFTNPIRDYRLPIKQLQNWFPTIVVTRKREEISNLLIDLVKEMHPEKADLLPEIAFPTQDGKLIETEENFEEAAEFEEEEMEDPSYEMEEEETDFTEEESPEKKKNGRKLLKRSFDKAEKNSPDKKIPRTN